MAKCSGQIIQPEGNEVIESDKCIHRLPRVLPPPMIRRFEVMLIFAKISFDPPFLA